MRAALLALVLAACGGRGAGTPPLKGDPRETSGIPVLPGEGDRAYVADTSGLVEVAPGAHQVIASPPVRWCTVDAKSRVVWFTTDTGLVAFDLDDRKIYPVILDKLDDLSVTIELGRQQLAQHESVDVDVALTLAIADTPSLRAEVGCDGDAYFRCYDEGGKLNQRMVELLTRAKKIRIEDVTYVIALAGRGAAGSLWSPPPMPPAVPASPVVDPKNCTVLTSCGQLTAIPGSSLWLVDTANSQGDYFHRSRELYDPTTNEFVMIDGGKLTRSSTQPDRESGFDTDYAGLRSSPSGLTYKGVVFTPSKVLYAPVTDDESPSPVSCGWASGGWRIP